MYLSECAIVKRKKIDETEMSKFICILYQTKQCERIALKMHNFETPLGEQKQRRILCSSIIAVIIQDCISFMQM